jgi:hypothetical protein
MRFLALLLVSLSAGVAAQAATPVSTKLEQAQAFDRYSACIAGRDPKTADLLALESRYSGELPVLIERLRPAMRSCLVGQRHDLLRISPFLLRGEMARALLMAGQTASRAYVPPSEADLAGRHGAAAREEQVIASYTACLASASPEPSLAFVRALSGSEAERTAFSELRPASERCAVETDRELRLGGDRLRAGLAITFYGRTASGGAS